MSKRKFGVGLIVGAIAGLVAGLLTAPKSGKETREDIKRKADEAKQGAAQKAEDAKKLVNHAREVADTAVDSAKHGFHRVQKDVEEEAEKPAK